MGMTLASRVKKQFMALPFGDDQQLAGILGLAQRRGSHEQAAVDAAPDESSATNPIPYASTGQGAQRSRSPPRTQPALPSTPPTHQHCRTPATATGSSAPSTTSPWPRALHSPGSHAPDVRACFAVHVPILALSHPPLWSEMVALGALHLLSDEKGHQKDPGLVACREAALDAALRTYRPVLGELGPHNADAAGFTAIFLLIDSFATLREAQHQHQQAAVGVGDVEGEKAGQDDDAYTPPMHWLRIVRGARAVLEAALAMAVVQKQGQASAAASGGNDENGTTTTDTTMSILTIIDSYPRVHYETARAAAAAATSVTWSEEPPDLGTNKNDDNPLTHLMVPLPDEPKQPTEVIAAYAGAVQQLNLIRTAIAASAATPSAGEAVDDENRQKNDDDGKELLFLCRGMMAFPCLVPPLFLDLVEERAPRALAVLAHYFALVARIRDIWWVGDTPAREVRAIRRALRGGRGTSSS
ncbi:hypothetical protein PG997_014256 [Apiospora hydei]|uniref:Uncharacterized protein n=1 Tax=Apiospora hydei TaxID=1337664 RepID=A0ABR1UTA0_9PEZI